MYYNIFLYILYNIPYKNLNCLIVFCWKNEVENKNKIQLNRVDNIKIHNVEMLIQIGEVEWVQPCIPSGLVP